MLNKLLKYDLKSIYKSLIIFYCLALFSSLITRLCMCINNSLIFTTITEFSKGLSVGIIFCIIINNFLKLCFRFIHNMYGDESYLTHTLPVTTKELYMSKFLTSIITLFTSTIVITICLFICYYSKDSLEQLKNTMNALATSLNSSTILLIIIFMFVVFLEYTFMVICAYSGIILGHKNDNNKIVYSVIYGVLFFVLSQIFTLLVIFIIGLFNPTIMNLFTTGDNVNINTIKIIMGIGSMIYLIYIVAYYLLDIKLLSKGVNVD